MRAKEEFADTYDKIVLINYILGLEYDLVKLTDADKALYKQWIEYRNNKDFENADKLRTQLVEKNII